MHELTLQLKYLIDSKYDEGCRGKSQEEALDVVELGGRSKVY